jgi:DNA-binding MarR family transcriptional regulator
MEVTGRLAANEGATAEGTMTAGAEGATAEETLTAGAEGTTAEGAMAAGTERRLAVGIAAGVERLVGLLRSLSPAGGLSATAAATLATLERSGPRRLTALAVQGGVTQPAMTQLIARLEDTGLVRREADPADGRVVQVRLTDQGRETLARRRAVRAERLAVILDRISPQDRAALGAALPAIDALASAQRDITLTH